MFIDKICYPIQLFELPDRARHFYNSLVVLLIWEKSQNNKNGLCFSENSGPE